MNAIQETIMSVLDANDGKASWNQLVEAVPYPERQKVMAHVRDLVKQGLVKRVVDPNAAPESRLTIHKVGE